MKYLKRVAALIAAVIMIVSCSATAFAEVKDAYSELDYKEYPTFIPESMPYMKFADALGIVSSYRNGFFNPQAKLTRAEALQIVYRMLHGDYDELKDYSSKNTDFDYDESGGIGDIKDTDVLKAYIAWAEDFGLVNAKYVENNMFLPDRNITATEFLTLIVKVLGLANGDELTEDSVYGSLPSTVNTADEPLYNTFDDVISMITTGCEVSLEDTDITREQAAVIVANAMVFDLNFDSYSEETFITFQDDNGARLNCLATNVYGCNFAQGLSIIATKQTPLDYDDVICDVLLSNGAQVDLGEDLSEYIGYPIQLVYQDYDESDTFTEDEKVLSFAIESITKKVFSSGELKFKNYNSIALEDEYTITSSTVLYLNGERWPVSEVFNLYKHLDGIINFDYNEVNSADTVYTIPNRPNLKFAAIQAGNEDILGRVYATEWIPGRIMTVTKNYVSFYSYYDGQVRAYKDKDVYYQSIANPKNGDFINFYESNGKLHIKAGTTMEVTNLKIASNGDVSGKQGEEIKAFPRHQMASPVSQTYSDPNSKITVVLDETGSTCIAYEETRATQETGVRITSVSASGGVAAIEAIVLDTNDPVTLNVPIENITAKTGQMNAGDIFTYYETENGSIYMFGVDEMTVDVIETAEYFLIENEQKLLKTDGFIGTGSYHTGTVTLLVDRYNGVWAVK